MNTDTINVIQFGTGNFLRAFVEPLFQNIKNKGMGTARICLIESTGSGRVKKLANSNYRYPVWVTGQLGSKQINEELPIDCIEGGISLPTDQDIFLDLARSRNLEWILSNVTEAGFKLENEQDMTHFPRSFPARLTLFLWERFRFFAGASDAGCHLLPCELIRNNGARLEEMVLSQARSWNLPADFFHWISDHNTFYNSLVDRIVPGIPSEETLDKFGTKLPADSLRVQAEPYFLLALQGKSQENLKLKLTDSDYSVLEVKNLDPFALRKVRILNGAHLAMVVLGREKEAQTVGEFMQDDELFRMLDELIHREVIPSLAMDPKELTQYCTEIYERFRNPYITHRLADISLNTMAKLQPRILDSIDDYWSRYEVLPERLVDVFTKAIQFYVNHSAEIRDTEEVKRIFAQAREIKNPDAKAKFLLGHPGLWKRDYSEWKALNDALTQALSK
ncbi:tagaturonate reductase [Algoriphagus namhaensis]